MTTEGRNYMVVGNNEMLWCTRIMDVIFVKKQIKEKISSNPSFFNESTCAERNNNGYFS